MRRPATTKHLCRGHALPRVRPALAWLLAVPLIAIGSQAAHALDYELVIPGSRRAAVLEATGHSYLNLAPEFLAISLSLILVALLWRIGGRRTRAFGGVPTWSFAVLPPLAFALQEHLERFLHSGDVPWASVLEPTFLPGILLQLPFALLAYAIARALLGAAGLISRLLRRPKPADPVRARLGLARPPDFIGRRTPPLASGCSLRGPPAPSPA